MRVRGLTSISTFFIVRMYTCSRPALFSGLSSNVNRHYKKRDRGSVKEREFTSAPCFLVRSLSLFPLSTLASPLSALTHSHLHSPALSLSVSLICECRSVSHTNRSYSLSLSLSHSDALSLFLLLTYSLTHSFPLPTLAYSLSLSLSPSHFLCLSFCSAC